MIEHVQDATPYQHSNSIWMKEGERNLDEIEELLEKRR